MKCELRKLKNDFLQLLFHCMEGFIVLVGGVGALDVGYHVVGAEACKGVNVAIGVVTYEITMVDPQDALGMEITEEPLLYLVSSEVWITVGRKQAGAGGHECAAAIALDSSTFEDEVEVRLIGAL